MTFASETVVKRTRKDHRCEFCCTTIPAGSEMLRLAGHWDGDFYTAKAHPDCRAMWIAAFNDFGDPWEGMVFDLVEAMIGDCTADEGQDILDAYRGRFPHPVCRIELRLLKSRLRHAEKIRARGFEPDPEDIPEIYA